MNYPSKYQTLPFERILSEYRRRLSVAFIESHTLENWVEVGCGNYPLPNAVPNKRWVVVEPNMEFRARIQHSSTIVYESFEQMRRMTAPCGVIIDSLLHELEEPRKLLLACIDKLPNDENIFRISVPNALSFHRKIAQNIGLIKKVDDISETGRYLSQARVYTPAKFEEELISAGLRIIKLSSYFPKLFTNAQLQFLLDSGTVSEEVFYGMAAIDDDLELNGAELVAICTQK